MIAETTPASVDELDASDMRRLSGGNDSALNELMLRHAEKLFGYLNRLLQNEEDAADLSQEAFVRVYQNRDRDDPGQKFSTWLYAIASNLAKDRYRWRTRHPQVTMDAELPEGTGSLRERLADPQLSPGERAQREERADLVRRAVQSLPEELRAPLILAEYEEKTQAEISGILGCSVKAVETRIYRARQRLRNSLANLIA